VVLIAAAGISLRLAAVATRERDRGAAALAQSERALRESDAVTELLVGLFEASDPTEGGQDALSATDLLKRGVARAEQLDKEPSAQARMLESLGRVYASRGELELGATLLRRALAVRRAAHQGDGDSRTATTAWALADVLQRQGKHALADTLAREAFRVRRAALGNDHPDVTASLQQLSGIAVYLGQFADAERYQLEAVDIGRRNASRDSDGLITGLQRLSAILWRRGDEAAPSARSAKRSRSSTALDLGSNPNVRAPCSASPTSPTNDLMAARKRSRLHSPRFERIARCSANRIRKLRRR
jgi:eukaryotic-like serine/threonine-protein kinase